MAKFNDGYPHFDHDPVTIARLDAIVAKRERIIGLLDAAEGGQSEADYALDQYRGPGGVVRQLTDLATEHIDLRTGDDDAFHPYIPDHTRP